MHRSTRCPGPRPLRIAFVTRCLERGGTELHLLRVLARLADHGLDVRLFVLARGGALEAEFERQGITIECVPRCGGRLRALFSGIWKLARFLRAFRPDAVHYFLPEPYVLGVLASPFAGRPVRLMSRRSLAHYQAKYPLAAAFERLGHRGTAALLGNSPAVIAELLKETDKPCKVGLIANGVAQPAILSAQARTALRKHLVIDQSPFVIIVVANLIAYKGHHDLLSALARIHPELPAGWRLLAVGRDGQMLNALRTQADAAGIAGNILWLGERADVESLLQTADLAVLASYEEGSPNSLIEAMSAGLPIVATDVGGNRELIGLADEATGMLVPPATPEALAEAILRMSQDAKLRAAAGARGKALVLRAYSIDACVARYLALYANLDRLAHVPVQSILDGQGMKTRAE